MAEMHGIGSNAWTAPRGRRRWREMDGRGMVAALRASGEEIAEFARRHGLHEERVRRWSRRMESQAQQATPQAPTVTFAPVRVRATASPAVDALEILVGGAVVRVHRGFDEALLRQVVGALGGGRC